MYWEVDSVHSQRVEHIQTKIKVSASPVFDLHDPETHFELAIGRDRHERVGEVLVITWNGEHDCNFLVNVGAGNVY